MCAYYISPYYQTPVSFLFVFQLILYQLSHRECLYFLYAKIPSLSGAYLEVACEYITKIAHPPIKKGSNVTHTPPHMHHTHTNTNTYTMEIPMLLRIRLVVPVRMTVKLATHMTKCKAYGSLEVALPRSKNIGGYVTICLINCRILNAKAISLSPCHHLM